MRAVPSAGLFFVCFFFLFFGGFLGFFVRMYIHRGKLTLKPGLCRHTRHWLTSISSSQEVMGDAESTTA